MEFRLSRVSVGVFLRGVNSSFTDENVKLLAWGECAITNKKALQLAIQMSSLDSLGDV